LASRPYRSAQPGALSRVTRLLSGLSATIVRPGGGTYRDALAPWTYPLASRACCPLASRVLPLPSRAGLDGVTPEIVGAAGTPMGTCRGDGRTVASRARRPGVTRARWRHGVIRGVTGVVIRAQRWRGQPRVRSLTGAPSWRSRLPVRLFVGEVARARCGPTRRRLITRRRVPRELVAAAGAPRRARAGALAMR
jgi:hypothetical protein